jgi:hypothetical protein
MFRVFSFFAVFKLAGWPKRAIIERGNQLVPEGTAAISLPLCLSEKLM